MGTLVKSRLGSTLEFYISQKSRLWEGEDLDISSNWSQKGKTWVVAPIFPAFITWCAISVIQPHNWYFLKGFMPYFIKAQLVSVSENPQWSRLYTHFQEGATILNLLNHYSVPNYQAFTSYRYFAAMHTDWDVLVTVDGFLWDQKR